VSPRPRDCQRCGVKPVAHAAVKFCYDCRPTFKKRKAPPCKRCGSLDYYSAGLCRRCHNYAPPLPDSCRFCHAWGLFKETSGVCPACQDWRRRHPGEADCRSCGTPSALHPDGVCRLCWRRARVLARHPEDPRDRAEAVIGGHQLHFAGMEQALALTVPEHRRQPPRTGFRPRRTRSRKQPVARPVRPVAYQQLVLFDLPRQLAAIAGLAIIDTPIPVLCEALDRHRHRVRPTTRLARGCSRSRAARPARPAAYPGHPRRGNSSQPSIGVVRSRPACRSDHGGACCGRVPQRGEATNPRS